MREEGYIRRKVRQLMIKEKVKREKSKNSWERIIGRVIRTFELKEEQAQDREARRVAI